MLEQPPSLIGTIEVLRNPIQSSQSPALALYPVPWCLAASLMTRGGPALVSGDLSDEGCNGDTDTTLSTPAKSDQPGAGAG